MSAKNMTKVLIDGKIITLGGYESTDYLQKVASYINNKIAELSEIPGYKRQAPDTKHTLLSLNIADDYFKAKTQAETLEEDIESKDKETYDMKNDMIASQIQMDKLQADNRKLEIENEALKKQVQELNQELEELLK
ncbi:MAG: cell division protein ZapA [Lachnospiraceae bacterium]|nr:cell division protein ZapA [Lachnospiraceae bacterium]